MKNYFLRLLERYVDWINRFYSVGHPLYRPSVGSTMALTLGLAGLIFGLVTIAAFFGVHFAFPDYQFGQGVGVLVMGATGAGFLGFIMLA